MSRNLSASFAAICGSMTFAGMASAQDFTNTAPPVSNDISPEWRVTFNPENSLLRRDTQQFPDTVTEPLSTISFERDFQINERSDLSLRFETESGGLQGFVDAIKSGGFPFSGSNRETGGSWGMKFKRGASIQYRFRW